MPILNAQGTQDINQKRIVIDMANTIPLLKPAKYPLNAILRRMAKEATHNFEFKWMEEELAARWVTVTGAVTDVATTINLTAGEGSLIAVGDTLKIVDTDEVVRVTAVATDALTVTRGFGVTAGTAINDGAKVVVLGNAHMQGSGAPSAKSSAVTDQFNYTQIFKTPFDITGTLDAMKLYGGKEWKRLSRNAGIEHARTMEHTFIFGERKKDLTGSQPLTATGGILQFLKGSAPSVDITKTDTIANKLKALDAFTEELFKYGDTKRMVMCSASWLTFLNEIARDKLQLVQADMDKTYGLDVTNYKTPHGTLQFVQHPEFVNGYGDLAVALDLEQVKYRPLTGRDTKVNTNIQNNDEDGRKDQYITEAGLMIKQPKKHGIMNLV